MSRRLPISAKDKRRIRLLYAEGHGPGEIVTAMKAKGIDLKPKQIANLVQKNGWTRQDKAIQEAREQGAKELLEEARKAGARDLKAVLQLISAGHLVDARKLRDGWELVENAADASSLQRAKGLLQSRVMEFHGLDGPPDEGAARMSALAVIVAYPEPERDAAAINVTATASAAGPGGANELEFEDDES